MALEIGVPDSTSAASDISHETPVNIRYSDQGGALSRATRTGPVRFANDTYMTATIPNSTVGMVHQ
jgi:hypothetical protein